MNRVPGKIIIVAGSLCNNCRALCIGSYKNDRAWGVVLLYNDYRYDAVQ